MYLALLNEYEKKQFLKLAYGVSMLDGNFGEAEKEMLNGYCAEMQITNEYLQEIVDKESIALDTVVKFFNQESSIVSKKIIVFEIVGLAIIDGKFDVKEKEFIQNVNVSFELESDYYIKCMDTIYEYLKFQNTINLLVLS